jgi:hypothetical protein
MHDVHIVSTATDDSEEEMVNSVNMPHEAAKWERKACFFTKSFCRLNSDSFIAQTRGTWNEWLSIP